MAASAEARRRAFDTLQKHLDEAYLNLQLFEKALDLFDDDPSISVILHGHLLQTTASEIVDMILLTLDFDKNLQSGDGEDESRNIDFRSLNSSERTTLAKGLPGSISTKALEMVEALEGKLVESFSTALEGVAKESGIWLKKLDEELERTLLHSYRKVHNKALQVPERSMAVAFSRLKDWLPETAYTTLMEYHSARVTLLALVSAGSYTEYDCTADRIMTKKELLESRMADLKALPMALSSGNTVVAANS